MEFQDPIVRADASFPHDLTYHSLGLNPRLNPSSHLAMAN